MYIRNKTSEKLSDFNHSSKFESGHYYLNRIVLLILIVAALILFSSLTNSEINSLSGFQDSLNTEKVYFDFGKSNLKPESFAILDRLAKLLKSDPKLKIEITGHTDNIGSDQFNQKLSIKRAEAVKAYLISKGCSSEQIITSGKGKSEPVNNNSNHNERSLNRRVEFRFIYPEKTITEDDAVYANINIIQFKENELRGELSLRDSTGNAIENINENDITAFLKWNDEKGAEQVAEGKPRLIPIDDKKKIAFTLTMDYSGSMFDLDRNGNFVPNSGKIPYLENAIETFVNLMNEKMFGKIIKFGKNVHTIQNFTENKQLLLKAIRKRSEPRHGTALYRSIYEAVRDTTYNSNPSVIKTVIAFTDGMENSSGNITLDSVLAIQNRYNTKIYTVGLLDKMSWDNNTEHDHIKAETDLLEIAINSGAFFYKVNQLSDLKKIYTQIFTQILNTYQLSIIWDKDQLPPKGTKVKAVVRINVKGKMRTIYKDYVME